MTSAERAQQVRPDVAELNARMSAVRLRVPVAQEAAGTVGDTPLSRCLYYRHVCHLPATVDPSTGRISMRAELMWAVSLPSEIGQRVKIDLDHHNHRAGPIVCHPRSGTWTFLTRSDISRTVAQQQTPLWRGRVTITDGGRSIALPSPADRGVFYRGWIRSAHSPYRPSGLALVASIRTILLAQNPSEITTELPNMSARRR